MRRTSQDKRTQHVGAARFQNPEYETCCTSLLQEACKAVQHCAPLLFLQELESYCKSPRTPRTHCLSLCCVLCLQELEIQGGTAALRTLKSRVYWIPCQVP